ncbi:hypothetical protein EJB00_03095 [Wolbachia endosymbiont of Drosophila mauritiana]|uniref:hypothetical protein n=1 Tax=unclassified Wolbachia TaxID=2640676 RepID=UPI0003A5C1B6|nr:MULTISPECIES: hypothetical protein [unclassified Wolbachia]QCB62603.1 hypothetical protein EJA99_03105 [Wolbachia endosymbiont of Drosophila mauritiana]QCB63649.1 hypothetical protein EJB00_03095 [Wolbachia endosymbiont of Drosophila mauritiana]
MDYKIKFLKNITEKDLPVLLAIWYLIIKELICMTPPASYNICIAIHSIEFFKMFFLLKIKVSFIYDI